MLRKATRQALPRHPLPTRLKPSTQRPSDQSRQAGLASMTVVNARAPHGFHSLPDAGEGLDFMQRGTLQHSGRGLQRPPFRLAPPREVPALPPSEVPQEQPLGPPPEFPSELPEAPPPDGLPSPVPETPPEPTPPGFQDRDRWFCRVRGLRGVLMTINEPPRQAAQDHLIKPMPTANRPPLRTRSMVPLVLSAALQN